MGRQVRHDVRRSRPTSPIARVSRFTPIDRVECGSDCSRGGVAVYDKGTFQKLRTRPTGSPAGPSSRFSRTRKAPSGSATSAGVSRIQNGRVTAVTQDNAPLKDLVPVLIEDLEGQIWVGVNSGAAVIRFHPSEVDRDRRRSDVSARVFAVRRNRRHAARIADVAGWCRRRSWR